ncbi:MAG: hypothetical protein AAGH83_08900 [Pseudomonadota bacterium]
MTFFPQVMVVDFDRAVMARPRRRSLWQVPFRGAAAGRPDRPSSRIEVNGTAVDGLRTVTRMGGRLNVLHRGKPEDVRRVLGLLELDNYVLTPIRPGHDASREVARALCDRYGKRGYALMAGPDAPQTIAAGASRAFLVGGTEDLRRELLVFGVPATLLPRDPVAAARTPTEATLDETIGVRSPSSATAVAYPA